MKIELITLVQGVALFVFTILVLGCSAGKGIGNVTGQPPSSNNKMDSVGSLSLDNRATADVLEKMSQAYGLADLGNAKTPDNILEVRFWSAPALSYPTCLILRRVDANWEAKLVAPDSQKLSRTTGIKRIPTIERDGLKPNSGWNFLEDLLRKFDVASPLSFIPDDGERPPIPDEGEFFLQIYSAGKYDFVGYRALTASPDGKRLKDLCSQLEKEFDVSIQCFRYD